MISIKRPPPPKIFTSPEFARERDEIRRFFSESGSQRTQRRMDWSRATRLVRGVAKDLVSLSHGHCAYCETPLKGQSGSHLAHHRPRSHAMDAAGEVAAHHYWWLALDWNNLVPSCRACSVAKAQRFPVDGTRAPIGATGRSLAAEEPLLLDPFEDDPGPHLIFDEQGQISPLTPRGAATIEILALNRQPLVEARQTQIEALRKVFVLLRDDGGNRDTVRTCVRLAVRHLRPGQPFLGAKRQLLELWLAELPDQRQAARFRTALHPLLGPKRRAGGPAHSRRAIATARSQLQTAQEAKERHSVETSSRDARTAFFGGVRRIERVVIRHFKAIRELTLNIAPPGTERESWLMLVGENAAGKSSILQAIALALLGQPHIGKLGLDARAFVTHGQTEGSVEVHLTNVSRPVVLRFTATDRRFSIDPPAELVLLLGYGATRLLPRTATTRGTLSRYVRVKNLFNPYARLQNAERWLTDRDEVDDELFDQIAISLKRLLLLGDAAHITRERTRVLIDLAGDERHISSLRELSDGYQSIVALAIDIMMGLVVRWSSMDVAEGVVLIDELETHLHPRWKMEIVQRLRTVFPKLTFVATTHDPLCLRGLEPGEIAVLRRQDGEVISNVVHESVAHLRADQLLTSELFGLYTTRAPEVNAAVLRHARLTSKTRRSKNEESELQALTRQLSGNLPVADNPVARAVEQVWGKVFEKEVLPAVVAKLGDRSLVANLPDVAKRALDALLSPAPIQASSASPTVV